MECPSCGKETHKIIFDSFGGHCQLCEKEEQTMYGNVVIRGENKYKPKMSRADIMHIQTRRICEDGVVRSAPRWETKDY